MKKKLNPLKKYGNPAFNTTVKRNILVCKTELKSYSFSKQKNRILSTHNSFVYYNHRGFTHWKVTKIFVQLDKHKSLSPLVISRFAQLPKRSPMITVYKSRLNDDLKWKLWQRKTRYNSRANALRRFKADRQTSTRNNQPSLSPTRKRAFPLSPFFSFFN